MTVWFFLLLLKFVKMEWIILLGYYTLLFAGMNKVASIKSFVNRPKSVGEHTLAILLLSPSIVIPLLFRSHYRLLPKYPCSDIRTVGNLTNIDPGSWLRLLLSPRPSVLLMYSPWRLSTPFVVSSLRQPLITHGSKVKTGNRKSRWNKESEGVKVSCRRTTRAEEKFYSANKADKKRGTTFPCN